MRYLGVDYGKRKIGLALGDGVTGIATPLEVLFFEAGDDRVSAVERLVKEELIDEVVIGVPKRVGAFHSDDQRKEVEAFIAEVKERTGKTVHEVDESYTSRESQRLQKEYGATAQEDALAAMLILQAFLDER